MILENQSIFPQYCSPIIELLFQTKTGALLWSTGVFHKNPVIGTCYTFNKVEIRTLTPKRFKNQTNDIFKLLGHNCNNLQVFAKQKTVPLQCYGIKLSCYWKLEQYWIKHLCVHSSPITQFFCYKKLELSFAVIFHKIFHIVACYTFDKHQTNLKLKLMTVLNYFATIAIIKKVLLNKNLLLFIVAA